MVNVGETVEFETEYDLNKKRLIIKKITPEGLEELAKQLIFDPTVNDQMYENTICLPKNLLGEGLFQYKRIK